MDGYKVPPVAGLVIFGVVSTLQKIRRKTRE